MPYTTQEFTHMAKSLDKLRFAVVKDARHNLAVKRARVSGSGNRFNSAINSSGMLSRSLKSKRKNLIVGIEMLHYGHFVDWGRQPGSWPPVDAIREWIRVKPIRLRDDGGRFMKQTPAAMNSLAFLIGRAIAKHGIKRTDFFTKPFDEHYAKYLESIGENMEKDLDNILPEKL